MNKLALSLLCLVSGLASGFSAVATTPIQIPIYITPNDYGPDRYTIYAGIGDGPIVPYLFDTGAPNLFSVIDAQGGNATSQFTFASGVSYNYFVKNIPKISLGDIYGNNLAETGAVNYAAVVSIGNQTTNGGPIADGTYGDFGAGLYGNSTLCTILSQIPIGGALNPGWIVDVAGRNGGNGTLTIGLTANAIASAKSTPGAIVMPMAFSGTSIATANGTIPGYNKAQVSGTTLSISKNCTTRTLTVPSVFDTGGGPNAVAYTPRFQGLGGGNMTLSYRGKNILSYHGTTPFGGNVVVDTNTQGGVRVNPGGAAIYENYKVVFSLNNSGTGEIILVPSAIPVYVSPFQISLNPNAADWCSDFIDRQQAINQNATPPMSQWTTALIYPYGPLNPQLYSTSSLSGNALAISQALASFDRGHAIFNVPMNQSPDGVSNVQWMTQRLLGAANSYIGTHYQHLHLPDFNPATINPQSSYQWMPVSNNPTLQSSLQLRLGQNGTASNPYLGTYGFAQPGIDCTDFTALIYNLALGIQMHSGTPNQVSFLTASGNATTLSPTAIPYTPAVDSQGAVVDALFFKSPNMGKAKLNASNSLENLTSQLQPGDLLYIGASNEIKHVVMWLGANGTNLGGTPSSVPLVISSHDNTPAIFDTQSLNATTGYPADGKIAAHLPPPGVQILPFAPGNWFYNNFILAARLLPTAASSPLVVPTGGISGTTNSISGQIINNSTVTFSQTTNGTFNGTVSGTGSLIKAGPGSVTLAQANTYSGGTSIFAGTLISGNASALGTGSVTLLSGNLTLNATTSIPGNLTWTGGSIVWKPGTVLNISKALTNGGTGGKIVISTATGLSMGQNIMATFASTNFKTSQIQVTRPPSSTFNGTISISGGKIIYNVTSF